MDEKKTKSILFNINAEVEKKFPGLVDDFGMVRVKKLEKIFKENEKLKEDNAELRKELEKLRGIFSYEKNKIQQHFP